MEGNGRDDVDGLNTDDEVTKPGVQPVKFNTIVVAELSNIRGAIHALDHTIGTVVRKLDGDAPLIPDDQRASLHSAFTKFAAVATGAADRIFPEARFAKGTP